MMINFRRSELKMISSYLHSKSKSKSHYDWRSVSLSVLVSSPVWGSWPDICSLFDSYCLVHGRAPSLTRGWVCLIFTLSIGRRYTVYTDRNVCWWLQFRVLAMKFFQRQHGFAFLRLHWLINSYLTKYEYNSILGFKVLTAFGMKSTVVWDTTPCSLWK
jgi:hypothetical protein